jgi:hypothetical protein
MLIGELERVLPRDKIARRLRWSAGKQANFIARLQRRATVVDPVREIDIVTTDPADNRVAEAAVEGRADYIVTGDRHLLDLKSHGGTRIATPKEFLAILAAEQMNL